MEGCCGLWHLALTLEEDLDQEEMVLVVIQHLEGRDLPLQSLGDRMRLLLVKPQFWAQGVSARTMRYAFTVA